MSSPRVVAIEPNSPAARAGLEPGDEIFTVNGEVPRDVIRWQILTDDADVRLAVTRDEQRFDVVVQKQLGEPMG
ncbi:MAG: PDZ domain-containing protein, partial [Acidimicrobiales bacterium]|nr:PDZ domain-containing protein [Acidimicrobiales bacterium]